VAGAYMVSFRFGKQHIDFVNPLIDYTSFFTTGGLTNARIRRFDSHLMNTEDTAVPAYWLEANIVSTLVACPTRHTENRRINNLL
jgi:hypothetical protein